MKFGCFRSAGSSSRRHGSASALADGLRPVPDDHPRDAFFTSPLRVTSLVTSVDEHPDGVRVSFVLTVKDAEGKRCPDVAVHARVDGPHRRATGMGHTSMMGAVTFRMSGPAGTYSCTVEDVAGGALGLDVEASTLHATLHAAPPA